MEDYFNEIKKLHKEMNKIFINLISNEKLNKNIQLSQDIEENNKEFIAKINLPDIDKKDIQLLIKNNKIEIKAQKRKELVIHQKNTYSHEKSGADFYKFFYLPPNVNAEEASSEYKNNILTIKIPKKDKKFIKAKTINVS